MSNHDHHEQFHLKKDLALSQHPHTFITCVFHAFYDCFFDRWEKAFKKNLSTCQILPTGEKMWRHYKASTYMLAKQ